MEKMTFSYFPNTNEATFILIYSTPPLGQDMTLGQFLSRV